MPFGWDDVIAAVGGGAQGAVDQQRFNRQMDVRDQVNELRSMIATMQESGKNTRAEADQKAKKDRADADRALKTKQIVDQSERGYAKLAQDNDLGWGRIATTERGQDLGDEHYWDTSARDYDLGQQRINTTQRGQNMASSTARRGQDLAHQDRGRALDQSGDSHAMSYALSAYGRELQRKKQASANIFASDEDQTPSFSDWIQQSDDPEIFPSVRRMFTPTAAAAQTAAPVPVGSGATPAAAANKGPLPVGPKVVPLEDQARQLLSRIDALESAGQDASAVRAQLAALRAKVKR